MYKYTLGFLIQNDQVLMINRNKSPWMGSWNGLGGKINHNETPRACIQREILEETNLDLDINQFIFKGYVTWDVFDALGTGLYIYIYYLDDHLKIETPTRVDEGIIDFKAIDWLCHLDNEGVAKNIPYFLPTILNKNDEKIYSFHCRFENKLLKEVIKKQVDK